MKEKLIFSTEKIREADSYAINEVGIPSSVLMEIAGLKCAEYIKEKFSKNYKFAILCGGGNNGGDGYVIARHLYNSGFDVSLYYAFSPKSSDCTLNFNICLNLGMKIKKIDDFDEENFIFIDAVFGSGFKGELPENLKKIYENKVKDKAFRKIAIDVPSGLNSDGSSKYCFKADLTFALGGLKTSYYSLDGIKNCGEIIFIDIGLDLKEKEAEFEIFSKEKVILPKINDIFHKGDAGKVAVIGGSPSYPGAPVLCAESSFVFGAGLSYCILPSELYGGHFNYVKNIIFKFEDEPEAILSFLKENNIKNVVLGPGMNYRDEHYVKTLINKAENTNFIIDADVFRLLKPVDFYGLKNKFVFTPHLKEFSDFLGVSLDEVKKDVFKYVKEFFNSLGKLDAVLVLKKPYTFVFGDKKYVIPFNVSALSKGGSGDVLAGMIASFIVRNGFSIDNIASACYLHAYIASEISKIKFDACVIPSDIIKNGGRILNEFK